MKVSVMKIEYVVMNQELPFSQLSIDNCFESNDAAEAAILLYFQTNPNSNYKLWVRKQFVQGS